MSRSMVQKGNCLSFQRTYPELLQCHQCVAKKKAECVFKGLAFGSLSFLSHSPLLNSCLEFRVVTQQENGDLNTTFSQQVAADPPEHREHWLSRMKEENQKYIKVLANYLCCPITTNLPVCFQSSVAQVLKAYVDFAITASENKWVLERSMPLRE